MMVLSESLRLLPDQALDLCCDHEGLRLAVSAASVFLLSSLRARLEEPLRLLQRRDDRLEASLSAGVAANHRVANAVMAAALHTDALAQRAQGTPLAPGLAQACQQLSRIGAMVTDVRSALSAHEGQGVEDVEWRPVVERVAQRRGLTVDLSQTVLSQILCVQGSAGLERILDELIDNVPEGATARIQVRAEGGLHLCVAVVDDGPGLSLPPATAREPFASGRSETAGVGLFVVDCLARASGARLEVRPGEQGGAFVGVHFLGDVTGA